MLNSAAISGITKIANVRIKKQYPLMSDHFKDWEIEEILCAYFDLQREYKKAVKEKK